MLGKAVSEQRVFRFEKQVGLGVTEGTVLGSEKDW